MKKYINIIFIVIALLGILLIDQSAYTESLHVVDQIPATNNSPTAEQIKPTTLVFLKFGDNTDYSEINTAKMARELLLTDLAECKYFSIVESFSNEETEEAENRLLALSEMQHEAIENRDFAFLFNIEDRNMNCKKRGDFLVKEDTKIIGEKYGADYLLHGAIEYLGAGINSNDSYLAPGLKQVTPYLAAIITVRLIRADTGEVVWAKSLKGLSKENYNSYQGIGYGTKKLNSQLFFRAVSKACQETQKAIELDFEKGLIKLTK